MKAPIMEKEKALAETDRLDRKRKFEEIAREAMRKYTVLLRKKQEVQEEIIQLMSELDKAQADAWDTRCEEEYRMKFDYQDQRGYWNTHDLVLKLVWDDELPPRFTYEATKKYLAP